MLQRRSRVNLKVMVSRFPTRLVMSLCLLGGAIEVCAGQAGYTPPPPQLTTLPPCPVPKDAKEARKIAKRTDCDPANNPAANSTLKKADIPAAETPAAEKFPFPGDAPAKPADPPAAKAFPYPGEQPAEQPAPPPAGQPAAPSGDKDYPYAIPKPGEASPNVPHDAAAAQKATDTSAGKAFPYPGDPAPANPAAGTDSGAGSTTSSSSGSTSSSSGDDDDVPSRDTAARSTNPDDDDGTQPKLTDKGSGGKRNKKTVKPQTDTERVDEDLSVAKFYGQSGNLMGAYLRAKDAVKTQPDYAEAHFVLGEASKRLNKRDEAKAEFNEYLKLAPDGERAKAAEKALSNLP